MMTSMEYDSRLACVNAPVNPRTQANLLDPNLSDSPAESAMTLFLDFSSIKRPERAISLEWSHMSSSFSDFG